MKRKFWHHDWYPLSKLRAAITTTVAQIEEECPQAVVMDLGCGDAPYRDIFQNNRMQYKTADIAGSPNYLIDSNGATSAEAGAFDVVVSFQVLEHVWDIDAYFAEVKRLLRANGCCLLSTHGVWLYHPHPGDYRRWTRVGLIREVETRGLQVLRVLPVVGPLGWLSVMRLMAYSYVLQRIPIIGKLLCVLCSVLLNARAVMEDWVTPKNIYNDNACVYLVVAKKRVLDAD